MDSFVKRVHVVEKIKLVGLQDNVSSFLVVLEAIISYCLIIKRF